MATPFCGIIMGYYGPIWSNEVLIDYATFCAENGLDSFIYGPKMDNYLRQNWKTEWPADRFAELQEIRAAFKAAGVKFGVAFSPYDVVKFDSTLQADLQARITGQINDLELDILSIGFDDYSASAFKAAKDSVAPNQLETAQYIQSISNAKEFYVVPTYYSNSPTTVQFNGPRPEGYWETFAMLDQSIGIFWTGSDIIPNGFSPNAIQGMNDIFNRKVTIWDNYPCNDPAWMTKTAANVYPFTGRPYQLGDLINGHFANPMLQTRTLQNGLIHANKSVLKRGRLYCPG